MDTWSDLCRSCLSTNSTVSLFDTDHNVSLKFLEITTIEVKQDDGLPQKLCDNCYSVMNTAYKFRKQCLKMNEELKEHLNTVEQGDFGQDNIDFANDPIKQLEAIIKSEPADSDDDCYYVVVIDDENKNKEENINNTNIEVDLPEINLQSVKVENLDLPVNELSEENKVPEELQDPDQINFENTIESFLVSNTKVPLNVPATILENEEEGQENDDNFNHIIMDVDSQDSSQDKLAKLELTDGNVDLVNFSDSLSSKNIIKILTTSAADGTLLLKSSDGLEYLANSQFVTSVDGDQEEEVIFCEGDESQFQILKCEGSELVIQYADDGDIATVLQQDDGKFLCECGKEFDDLSEFEKHQYIHNPAGDHLCNLCGKGFESAEILTGHTLLHSESGILVTCPFCKQVVRRNALTQHIKYGHNNIKPKCDVCLKTFANPNNLKRHMMIHNGIREFECDICFKRFHQKITMQTHRLTHMNPFSCNQCDQTFMNKPLLTAHKNNGECTRSKVTKVKEELMKTVKQEVTTTVGKLLGYACSLCKRMFSLESALEEHVENIHMVDPTELLCSECGEVLPSKKDMQIHIASHKNIKTKNLKRFECSICGKSCTSQAMLTMHERVHTNERPFPCQLCALKFKTKTHLRTHQLTHTREKKFGCSVCMKFFALKGNLVVHLRTHTGERPYVCSLCGDSFIDSKYLKKHKLKKHLIDNVPWNKY